MSNNIEEDLKKQEEEMEEQDDSPILPPENVFTYTELRSCSDIFKMVKKGKLKKDPFYQRDDIWLNPQKTRFIDSLAKRLPIPSMCFSVDKEHNYQVIDGRQRVSTIIEFLDEQNEDWRLSKLPDIDERISGKTIKEIKQDQNGNKIFESIEQDVTLPITILRCDYNREDNLEYIFKIFHRLNEGGLKLNNQEIRNCIYTGSFNDLLNKCNQNTEWKNWVQNIANDKRFKGQERILTFYALYFNKDNYKGRMASFLNDFMYNHRKANDGWINEQEQLFNDVVNIASKIKLKSIRNVYIDAILFGIAKNLSNCSAKSPNDLQTLYDNLLKEDSFSHENLKAQTTNKELLIKRLDNAQIIFGE